MATNTAPTYGYRTAKQTTKLPSYYDSAPKPQPLFGGSFASSFLQSPLVAGATQAKPVAPQHPTQISPQGVAKQTTGFNEGTQATGQNQTTQPAATSPSGGLVYDYTADPILQQIQALSLQSRQDADTGALQLRKQIAIKYGDPEYARNVLGDTGTADAAAGNPYSVYAQLKKQQHDAADSLDEQLNQNNLFYGGYRVKQQGQLADEYGRANAAETANEQAALGQVDQGRMAAYSAANAQDIQAQQQAQWAALQMALQNASGPAAVADATGAPERTTQSAGEPDYHGTFQTPYLQPPVDSGTFHTPYLQPPHANDSFVPSNILDELAHAAGPKPAPANSTFAPASLLDALAQVVNQPKKKPAGKKPLD